MLPHVPEECEDVLFLKIVINHVAICLYDAHDAQQLGTRFLLVAFPVEVSQDPTNPADNDVDCAVLADTTELAYLYAHSIDTAL
jgi:hypothetical protein